MRRLTSAERCTIGTILILATVAMLMLAKAARAETMIVERVVPPGSTLSYSEGGSVVRTIAVPEGRVRVTIEFSGPIRPRHRGVRR